MPDGTGLGGALHAGAVRNDATRSVRMTERSDIDFLSKNRVMTHFERCQYSPPRRGGVDARSIRRCEATLFRADGVVRPEPRFRRSSFTASPYQARASRHRIRSN